MKSHNKLLRCYALTLNSANASCIKYWEQPSQNNFPSFRWVNPHSRLPVLRTLVFIFVRKQMHVVFIKQDRLLFCLVSFHNWYFHHIMTFSGAYLKALCLCQLCLGNRTKARWHSNNKTKRLWWGNGRVMSIFLSVEIDEQVTLKSVVKHPINALLWLYKRWFEY